MASMMPMALYGLEVPCGDVAIPAKPEIPSAFRITMAAIDPSAEPEGEEGAPRRATLKVIRQPLGLDDFSDEDDMDDDEFDADEMEQILAEQYEDEDEDEEEDDDDDDDDDDDVVSDQGVNGEGPSDPAKSKKARQEAAKKEITEMLENGDNEAIDVDDDTLNGVNGVGKSSKAKGKMPRGEVDEDEEDDDYEGEIEEFTICTLDVNKTYQQPLDITIGEDERVWFKVSGTHSIFLTGNYVEPANEQRPMLYDPDDDDEGVYDLEPGEDELEDDDDADDEEDELDDLRDPRIMELRDEDEDEAPKLTEPASQKKKAEKKADSKKRPAPGSDDAEPEEATTIDELISKSLKTDEPATNGEPKLSKKQLKKLKKNDGSAVAVVKTEEKKAEPEAPSSSKSDKKVSFAKELEQGPTPTKDKATVDKAAVAEKGDNNKDPKASKATLGAKVVQGVTIDDRKLGTGPAAKKGDRVSMRYIGKLEKDKKVFDSNTKGKPFSFKLGAGEVIKGWDIGVVGMSTGGERRITIPASLAYGSKGQPPAIPSNSTLMFDVKMLEIGKK